MEIEKLKMMSKYWKNEKSKNLEILEQKTETTKN